MSLIPISSMHSLRLAQDRKEVSKITYGASKAFKGVYFLWRGKIGKIIGHYQKQLRVQWVHGTRLLPPEVITPQRVQILFHPLFSD